MRIKKCQNQSKWKSYSGKMKSCHRKSTITSPIGLENVWFTFEKHAVWYGFGWQNWNPSDRVRQQWFCYSWTVIAWVLKLLTHPHCTGGLPTPNSLISKDVNKDFSGISNQETVHSKFIPFQCIPKKNWPIVHQELPNIICRTHGGSEIFNQLYDAQPTIRRINGLEKPTRFMWMVTEK